jgi:hypothetical protein
MNKHLQAFARNFIKERLKQLPAEQQLFFNRMYSHLKLDRTVDEAVDAMPADKLSWAMEQVETSYTDGVAKGTVQAIAVATPPAEPNFDAARKFLQLYGQPRPGYDTTVSGMVEHLRKEGYPTAYPAWAYTTGGILQPEQALLWLAHLFAVGPVPADLSAAETPADKPAEPLQDAPPGFTWRCRDCYGPLGEEHSENCGIGRGLITREHVGDSPIPNRAD